MLRVCRVVRSFEGSRFPLCYTWGLLGVQGALDFRVCFGV